MPIKIQSNYNSPTFQANKANTVRKFLDNQYQHMLTQSLAFAAAESIHPSTSLQELIIKKGCCDLGEMLANGIYNKKNITPKNQCTNLFSWIYSGVKTVLSKISK